jgi:tetratricopeptide (TPR) repeat protein
MNTLEASNMQLRLVFLIITLSVCFKAVSQSPDSLLIRLQTSNTDSEKISVLLDLAEFQFKHNSDSFYHYSKNAYILAQGTGFKRGINKSTANIARFFKQQGKYDSSFYYYNISLNSLEQDDPEIAQALYNLGNVRKAMNEFEDASQYYFRSLRISEANNNTKGIAIASLGLGGIYIEQKEVDQALLHYRVSLEKFKEINDARGEYISINNIGTALFEAGRYDGAKPQFKAAETMAKRLNDERGLGDIYSNMGIIYEKELQYDSSLNYHLNALALRKKFTVKQGIVKSYHNLCSIYTHLQQYKLAQKYLDSAYTIVENLNNVVETKYYWNYKVKLDTARGDFESAVNSFIQYSKYKDLAEDNELKNEIAELQTQYETEKKDQAIASLSQEAQIKDLEISQRNIQLIGAGIILLLLVLGGVVLMNQRKYKHQQAVSDMEQRFLRLQMNPHFIFNALAAIQTYILQNNTKESVSYLAKFGKLMRQILEHSREEFITVQEESDMLRNYLEIQQLRFQGKFDFKIEIDESIDAENMQIPPLFAQPFVENAIEHGLKEKVSGGLVTVRFLLDGKNVRLEIEDNGAGFANAKLDHKTHKSLATVIIKDRLALFEQRLGYKLTFEIKGLSQGTLASISLPVG